MAKAAAVAATAVFGVAVTRTGRMLPWLRHGTLRPVPWGYDTPVGGAGLLLIVTNPEQSYLAHDPPRPGHHPVATPMPSRNPAGQVLAATATATATLTGPVSPTNAS